MWTGWPLLLLLLLWVDKQSFRDAPWTPESSKGCPIKELSYIHYILGIVVSIDGQMDSRNVSGY